MDLLILDWYTSGLIMFIAWLMAWTLWWLTSWWWWIISFSTLIFLWVPPHIAVATDRFWNLGYVVWSVYKFFKSDKIVFSIVKPLIILSIIWSIIWTNLVININTDYLSIIVWVIILGLLPLMIFKKWVWLSEKKISKNSYLLWNFLFFLVAIYDWFLWIAWGIFCAYILVMIFWLTYIQSNATEKVPYFFNSIISIWIFAFMWVINYVLWIALLAWNLIWWYLWAYIALKRWEWFVRALFIVIWLITAIKLIFF